MFACVSVWERDRMREREGRRVGRQPQYKFCCSSSPPLIYCKHIHTREGNNLKPHIRYAHTGHSHTQRWGRQNEVKRRGNKSPGVQLLIASWVHHFKQAETAGEESGAEQRSSQLGWLMHSGEALHRPTLSLALGDCLPYQRWAWPMQLRRGWWGLDVWSGWVLEEERVWWEKLFLFFSTSILARGCCCGWIQVFDRRHPLPVGPLNWAPTSQPGSDVSVSRITTN